MQHEMATGSAPTSGGDNDAQTAGIKGVIGDSDSDGNLGAASGSESNNEVNTILQLRQQLEAYEKTATDTERKKLRQVPVIIIYFACKTSLFF